MIPQEYKQAVPYDALVSVAEFMHRGEWVYYYVAHTDTYIFVGSMTSGGFTPVTYMEKDEAFSEEKNLEYMIEKVEELYPEIPEKICH